MMIRVGDRLFNPNHISLIEVMNTVPPSLKVRLGDIAWELTGADAEMLLNQLGHGKPETIVEVSEPAKKAK